MNLEAHRAMRREQIERWLTADCSVLLFIGNDYSGHFFWTFNLSTIWSKRKWCHEKCHESGLF